MYIARVSNFILVTLYVKLSGINPFPSYQTMYNGTFCDLGLELWLLKYLTTFKTNVLI